MTPPKNVKLSNRIKIWSIYCRIEWDAPHSKNILLTGKLFLSLLKDLLSKIGMRGNPLTVKGLSFQMLPFYCQSISFGLEMKSFVIQRKYNFEDKIIVYYVPRRTMRVIA